MKGRVLEKCRNNLGVFYEKCMEWVAFIKARLTLSSRYHSNLVEEYTIKSRYMNCGFVHDFLSERQKIVTRNRYRMQVKEWHTTNPSDDVIGYVTIYRRRELIDRATLIIKPGEKEKLIYWKFNNN